MGNYLTHLKKQKTAIPVVGANAARDSQKKSEWFTYHHVRPLLIGRAKYEFWGFSFPKLVKS